MDRNIIESIIHGEIIETENHFEEWGLPEYEAGYLAALKWVTTLLNTYNNDGYED